MIVDELIRKINDHAEKSAIIWKGKSYSYHDIYQLIDWYSSVIRKSGMANEAVVILGDYSPYTISFLIAAMANNCVVIPLVNKPEKVLQEYYDIVQMKHIVKFDDNGGLICDLSRCQQLNKKIQDFKKKHRPGLVIFTSGSTGSSKAILHDVSLLIEKFRISRKSVKIISFLLFDHIGGINTLFYTLFNGGCLVVPQDRSVISVCAAIDAYKVEALTTTPTFLNLLILSQATDYYRMDSLKVINYGTEIMLESLLLKLHTLFPQVRLSQAYGLSEVGVLPIRSVASNSSLIKFDSSDEISMRIRNGMLEIKSPTSMIGYLNYEESISKDGWFETGDMVEVEGDYLRILGRQTDIINVGGVKVYPAEVENLLIQMDNVEDVIVYAIPNSITGNIVAVKFQLSAPEDRSQLQVRMNDFCRNKLQKYKIPQKVVVATDALYGERFKKIRNIRS